jgi:hypothetical protein
LTFESYAGAQPKYPKRGADRLSLLRRSLSIRSAAPRLVFLELATVVTRAQSVRMVRPTKTVDRSGATHVDNPFLDLRRYSHRLESAATGLGKDPTRQDRFRDQEPMEQGEQRKSRPIAPPLPTDLRPPTWCALGEKSRSQEATGYQYFVTQAVPVYCPHCQHGCQARPSQ